MLLHAWMYAVRFGAVYKLKSNPTRDIDISGTEGLCLLSQLDRTDQKLKSNPTRDLDNSGAMSTVSVE